MKTTKPYKRTGFEISLWCNSCRSIRKRLMPQFLNFII